MTTPRTMDSVRKAAEKAGERRYEQRRRAAEEAAKQRAAKAEQPDAGDFGSAAPADGGQS